ncbi:MAG: Maltose-binding periplasmic protein [Nocardioides sp.]|nr:Maltose-binding periplasmic protein [Nocardioides sp.]
MARSLQIPNPGMSRRTLLGGLGAAAGGIALSSCGVGGGSEKNGENGVVTLDFVAWTYAMETVQKNVAEYMAAHPKTKVSVQDYGWDQYHDTLVQRLSSNSATDVLYNNGSWLAEFASAGFIAPVGDYLDFDKYAKDMVPYVAEGLVYEGQPYGLPYYADMASFIWNPTVAKKYGVDRAPSDWDELTDMASTMKSKGLSAPILWEFSQTNPSSLDEFIAMSMSRGGEVFDDEMNPVFEDPSSPAFQHAEFMASTVRDGLATTSPAEMDAMRAMNTGQHAFTCMYNYNLAGLNNKGTSPLAGQFELIMMPGPTQATLGYYRFYSLSSMAVDRGAAVAKGAGNFIEAMGGAPNGEYTIAKRWALDRGLGFGIVSLFDDPDVQKAFGQWVDVSTLRDQQSLAQVKREAKWTGIWGNTMLQQLSKAFAGEVSVADAMKVSADKARELKEKFA